MTYRGFSIERAGTHGAEQFRFIVTGPDFRFERYGNGCGVTTKAAAKRIVDSEIRRREAVAARAI